MISWLILAISPAADATEMKFLDAEYASTLCTGWNQTTLPAKLGRNGSGWIDSADSQGAQVVVIQRRDCSNWKPVMLHIEADGSGAARCVKGALHAGEPFQWRFQPTTEQWADFSDGFGVLQMPGIMSGFVGPYNTAAANVGNFEVFFALAGKLALENQVDWTCAGSDTEAVAKEVGGINRTNMQRILGP
jgi:hypothetical protein